MSKNFIDEKVTVWRRYHIKDGVDMNKVVSILKKKDSDMNDLEFDEYFESSEIVNETEEPLTPEENHNNPTIEVFERDKSIWQNFKYKD